MNYRKGFTLIELLVVISIISLLSSIVLASLSSARTKAKLAAAQTFNAHNEQVLGASASGWWDFEQIVNGKISDNSGNNYTGTLMGGAGLASGIKGNALALVNPGQYLDIGQPVLNKDESFTLSAWIYMTNYETYWGTNVFNQDTFPNSGITFGTRGPNDPDNYKKFGYWSSGGLGQYYTDQIIPLNEWHHILFSWNKTTGKTRLYYDGVDKGGLNGYYTFTPSTEYLHLGYDANDGQFFGKIDEVRIYSEALSVSQIEKLYAEGAEKHFLAVKK